MKYYEIEIFEPTNNGDYSRRKIFTNREEAQNYLDSLLAEEEFEEVEENEWTDTGPNWKRLKTYAGDWHSIYFDEIEN